MARAVNGATLIDLHGEDVELHDSHTRASWKQQREPDPRRIVLSNRPLTAGDFIYITLSGTGCTRLGVTNYSEHDDDPEEFLGEVLFEDVLYNASIHKQMELKSDGATEEVEYCYRYETDKNTIQRTKMPEQMNRDNLYLFCEIRFGNIRVSVETKYGKSLIVSSVTGEQIMLDERDFAMLTNTTGSVVIPEIELKIDKPVHIDVKPKQKLSKGFLLVRYGLTNVPPSATTEKTLMTYCLARVKLKDDNQDEEVNNPSWFRNDEIRVEDCSGLFTVGITKDFDLTSNINRDFEEKSFVVMGADLQKPVWLVVEVFQADVMVEFPHELQEEVEETALAGDDIASSIRIIAIWEGTEIADEAIGRFVNLKVEETPVIVRGSRGNRVMMVFKKERSNYIRIPLLGLPKSGFINGLVLILNIEYEVAFLKNRLTDQSFWKLIHLIGIKETSRALVCNLPPNEQLRNIRMFFDNEQKVKMVLNIKRCDPRPAKGEVILQLDSLKEVQPLCKKNLKYKERLLKIFPYYEILDDHDEAPGKVNDNENGIEIPDFFDETYDNIAKIKYAKDFKKKFLEQVLGKVCSEIKWRENQGKDVRFSFKCQCGNTEVCKRNWMEKSKEKFTELLDCIVIERRHVAKTVWDQVIAIVESDEVGEDIRVLICDERLEVDIIGMRDNVQLAIIISTIDAVKEPPPMESKSLNINDMDKLDALVKFQILSDIEESANVSISFNNEGQVTINGISENISDAIDRLLHEAAHIQKITLELPSKYCEELMNTQMVRDKIEHWLSEFKVPVQWKIKWKVSNEQLIVISTVSDNLSAIADRIKQVIETDVFQLDGDATEHKISVDTEISNIQKKYNLYARINYKIKTTHLEVHVTCVNGYLQTLQEKLITAISPFLKRNMRLLFPEYITKYIHTYLMDELRSNLKREKLNPALVQYENGVFITEGTTKSHKYVKNIVQALVSQIQMDWLPHTVRGIDMYFSEKQGIELLHAMKTQCSVQLLTKSEMKENNVHAVAVLESGTAIFALAGDLVHPVEPVDVIVNPTDSELRHNNVISHAIAKAGGIEMKQECSDYQQKNGALKPGDIFISSAGKLPCQKVFHVVQPSRNSEQGDKDLVIKDLLTQILHKTHSDAEGIFRSIALPLLGDVTNSNMLNRSAAVIIETFRDNLGNYRNVREIFFYDVNPRVVRVISSEMQAAFGNRCFTLPVENVDVNKARTLKPSSFHGLRRTGLRTIPLPGDRKFHIRWGELQYQHADVIVNITTSASSLSGLISKKVCDTARSHAFDLGNEYKKEVKKIQAVDGAIVQTSAGQLPCNVVYHLKIETNWPAYNGPAMLESYIQTCLLYAIKTERSSIAFPTIGTVDCSYPKNEVAQTFIRTVGEFMKRHPSCTLNEVSVVIFKDDHDCTLQFEETASRIYSKRPHRLQAVIEEARELNKEGEAHEEKEKKQMNEPQRPQLRQPQQPQPAQQAKGKAAASTSYQVTNNVTLSLAVENIETVAADVIVCTTAASSFPNLFGAIPDAMKRAGGPSLQTECKQKYPHGIPPNDIASTDAGTLKCQTVFYIPLQEYKSSADATRIKDYVKRCLAKADTLTFKSICFPTIGTGNFKYPNSESAQETFSAIQEYFSSPPQHLQKVVIALFRGAPNAIQEFQQRAASVFKQIGVPQGSQGSSDQQKQQQSVQHAGKSFIVSIPNTSTTIEIYEGQLELSAVDVIVNTTTSFPNLNGAIPDAICRQGGPSIKDECNQYHGTVDDGDIIETNAGNLQCKKLFHYVLPSWDSVGGTKIIQNCVTKCLILLSDKGYESIAFPAIGTGGYRYEPRKVAKGIYRSVLDHAKHNSDTVYRVKIVLYQPAKDVNKVVTEYFQQLPPLDDVSNTPQPKRVRFEDDDPKTVRNTPSKTDFVLLKLVSKDKKTIERTKVKIFERITAASVQLSIPFPVHGDEILKDKKNMKILQELGTFYHVDINVDHHSKEIHFNGISPKREECREKVRSLLNDMSDKKGNLIVGKTLLQNVEWCYEENNGKIMVPYPKSIAYNLETERSRGANTVNFKDTDDKEYVVDLQTMEEFRLENNKRGSVVKISRKDLSSGELARFPDSWDPMDESSDVAEVPLAPDSLEYKTVSSEFEKTIGNFQLSNINQIRRIQNKYLYHQYMAEKKDMDKKNQRKDNERILWHGTSMQNEKAIIENGLSSNYSGNTFGGVWYGKGVYFAVHSEYSTAINYSPPDPTGVKRVFQVKVLTGEYTRVNRNYAEKFAPLKPGSDKDRFDSVCDNDQNPTEFVIFRDTVAYPQYIILFQ